MKQHSRLSLAQDEWQAGDTARKLEFSASAEASPAGHVQSSGPDAFERPSRLGGGLGPDYTRLQADPSPRPVGHPPQKQSSSRGGFDPPFGPPTEPSPSGSLAFDFREPPPLETIAPSKAAGLAAFDGVAVTDPDVGAPVKGPVYKRHRRRLLWCSLCCCLALLVVLVTVILVGYFVFRPRTPTFKLQNVRVSSFSPDIKLGLPPRVVLNFDIAGVAVVHNPNTYDLEYRNSTAYVYYAGQELGRVSIKEGVVGAKDTVRIPTEVNVKELSVTGQAVSLIGDVQQNTVPLNFKAVVEGRVKWFVFERDFTVYTACDFKVDPNFPRFQSVKIISTSCDVRVEDGG